MKMPFMQAVRERVLVLDGAMGTMLQERGLKAGQSPEELNLTAPEIVAGVHQAYLDAGADIIVTNTFGGSISLAGNTHINSDSGTLSGANLYTGATTIGSGAGSSAFAMAISTTPLSAVSRSSYCWERMCPWVQVAW